MDWGGVEWLLTGNWAIADETCRALLKQVGSAAVLEPLTPMQTPLRGRHKAIKEEADED